MTNCITQCVSATCQTMQSDIEAWRNSRVVATSFGFGWLVRFIYSLNFTACNWRLTASYIKRGLQALHVDTPKALFVEKFNISASTYVSSVDSYAAMSDQTWSYFTRRPHSDAAIVRASIVLQHFGYSDLHVQERFSFAITKKRSIKHLIAVLLPDSFAMFPSD